MNRDEQSGSGRSRSDGIEARLERSLRKQVTAPRLDGRFNAAIWTRIAAEEKKASPPLVVRSRMPRWLMACNALGVAVTAVLVVAAAMRSMSGLDLGLELNVELPTISAEQQLSLLRMTGSVIAAAALIFGVMFTRIGRRILSLLR